SWPLSMVLTAWLASGQAGTTPMSIRGVVRDQTGAVLRGAKVELVTDAGAPIANTSADANGLFHLDAPAPGTYILRVSFEGFRVSSTTIRIAARRAPPPQVVVLDLAAVPQDITVTGGDDVIRATTAANRDAVTFDDAALK